MAPNPWFQTAFWVTLALMFLVRGFFAWKIKQAGERFLPDSAAIEREGRGTFLARLFGFFVLIGLLVLYAVNPAWFQVLAVPLPAALRWAGFGIGLAGTALVFWSEAVLGRRWSAQLQLRKDHQLVTTGPYSLIRHPLYTGLVGFGLAVALVSASGPFLLFVPLTIWGLIDRIPKEEKMLSDEFGEEWKAYAGRTKRLLPWVW